MARLKKVLVSFIVETDWTIKDIEDAIRWNLFEDGYNDDIHDLKIERIDNDTNSQINKGRNKLVSKPQM